MTLKNKLTILFTSLAIIPLIFTTYLGYLNQREAILIKTTEQLSSLAELQEDRVNELLAKNLGQIRLITSRTQLRKSIASFIDKKELSDHDNIIKILNDAQKSVSAIQEITVFGLDGLLVASTISENKNVGIDHEEMIKKGKTTNQLFTVIKNDQNVLTLQFVGPIILEDKVIAVVEVLTDASDLIKITEDYTGLGNTGEIIIATPNSFGDALFLTPLRFDSGAALTRAISKDSTNVPVISAILGNSTILTSKITEDYRGVSVIAATKFSESLGWGIVAKIDRAEAFESINQLAKSYISITLLSIFVILLISIITTNAITNSITKLILVVKKYQSGSFSERVKVNQADEIGVLGEVFNEMASQVQDTQKNLENKVKLRTKDLNRFKLAVEESTDAYIMTDLDAKIIYVNKAWSKLNGYSQNEVLNKNPNILKSNQTDPKLIKEMWRNLEDNKAFTSTGFINKRKDGSTYNVRLAVFPVNDKDDAKSIYYVAIQRDITEETAIDKAKTEFVSLASHQLRTPLSSISWYAEMLLAGDAGKLNKQQKNYLEEVYDSNHRLIDLVNALLNVSRIDMGTFSIEPEKIDIVKLAKGTITEIEPMIFKNKIEFIEDYDELGEMYFDPGLLQIVFQNLLTNAVKYTPNKGKVEFSIKKITKSKIPTKYKKEFDQHKNMIYMQVKDNGYGIPKDQQDHIFTKLFRADNIRKTSTNGTGLGLYIAKSIAEAFGGAIWFTSTEGKGTIFNVLLPISNKGGKKTGTKKLS